jgi:hypothetical protein
MTIPPTDSQEHNLYLRIQNSAMSEALHDTAQRLGFVYLGAQGFVGAAHRAVERVAMRRVAEMAAALRAAGVAESVIESAQTDAQRASDASASGLDAPTLARAMEAKVIVARGAMVVASAEFGTYRFPAAPEDVAAWGPKIGQRAMIEWALVPMEGDAPAQEEPRASEGVSAGVLHPAHKGGL